MSNTTTEPIEWLDDGQARHYTQCRLGEILKDDDGWEVYVDGNYCGTADSLDTGKRVANHWILDIRSKRQKQETEHDPRFAEPKHTIQVTDKERAILGNRASDRFDRYHRYIECTRKAGHEITESMEARLEYLRDRDIHLNNY